MAVSTPSPTREYKLWVLLVVVGTLIISNVVANRVIPSWAYVPWNCTMALLITVVALRMDHHSLDDLGMARRKIPAGLRLGGAFSGILLAGYVVGVLLPWTRELFQDDRADVGVAPLLQRIFIAVPLGTVLLEEVAFRGVLPAMFKGRLANRARPHLIADMCSAVLFGLWHILPSWNLNETNSSFAFLPDPLDQALVITGGVLGTAAVGMFFSWMRNRSDSLAAPILLHTTSNSAGYLFAWAVQNW